MSHANGANGADNGYGKRERRTILEPDAALLKELQALPQPIQFRDLTIEQKLALIPGANPRLVRFKLVNIDYDQDSFAPTTVTIDEAMVEHYRKDIEAPARQTAVSNRKPLARVRANTMASLYIAKVDPPKKPRNPGTEAGYNYDLYENGMTIAQYLDATYDRNLKTRQGKWFNGPSYQLLYADMDAGNVWIHDVDGNAKEKKDVMPRGERNFDVPGSDPVTEETAVAA